MTHGVTISEVARVLSRAFRTLVLDRLFIFSEKDRHKRTGTDVS